MAYWQRIDEVTDKDSPVVVASGLFSAVAKWDGLGWWAVHHGRYIAATHFRKYVPFPWSPEHAALSPSGEK